MPRIIMGVVMGFSALGSSTTTDAASHSRQDRFMAMQDVEQQGFMTGVEDMCVRWHDGAQDLRPFTLVPPPLEEGRKDDKAEGEAPYEAAYERVNERFTAERKRAIAMAFYSSAGEDRFDFCRDYQWLLVGHDDARSTNPIVYRLNSHERNNEGEPFTTLSPFETVPVD